MNAQENVGTTGKEVGGHFRAFGSVNKQPRRMLRILNGGTDT